MTYSAHYKLLKGITKGKSEGIERLIIVVIFRHITPVLRDDNNFLVKVIYRCYTYLSITYVNRIVNAGKV